MCMCLDVGSVHRIWIGGPRCAASISTPELNSSGYPTPVDSGLSRAHRSATPTPPSASPLRSLAGPPLSGTNLPTPVSRGPTAPLIQTPPSASPLRPKERCHRPTAVRDQDAAFPLLPRRLRRRAAAPPRGGRRAPVQQANLHPRWPVQHGRPRRGHGHALGRRGAAGLRALGLRPPPLPLAALGAGQGASAPGHRRKPHLRGRPRDVLRQRRAPLRRRARRRRRPRALRRRRHADGRVGQGVGAVRGHGAARPGRRGDRRPDRGRPVVPGRERHRALGRRQRVRAPDGRPRPRPPAGPRHAPPPPHPGWAGIRAWAVHRSRKGSSKGIKTSQREVCRCDGVAIPRRPSASEYPGSGPAGTYAGSVLFDLWYIQTLVLPVALKRSIIYLLPTLVNFLSELFIEHHHS